MAKFHLLKFSLGPVGKVLLAETVPHLPKSWKIEMTIRINSLPPDDRQHTFFMMKKRPDTMNIFILKLNRNGKIVIRAYDKYHNALINIGQDTEMIAEVKEDSSVYRFYWKLGEESGDFKVPANAFDEVDIHRGTDRDDRLLADALVKYELFV